MLAQSQVDGQAFGVFVVSHTDIVSYVDTEVEPFVPSFSGVGGAVFSDYPADFGCFVDENISVFCLDFDGFVRNLFDDFPFDDTAVVEVEHIFPLLCAYACGQEECDGC